MVPCSRARSGNRGVTESVDEVGRQPVNKSIAVLRLHSLVVAGEAVSGAAR